CSRRLAWVMGSEPRLEKPSSASTSKRAKVRPCGLSIESARWRKIEAVRMTAVIAAMESASASQPWETHCSRAWAIGSRGKGDDIFLPPKEDLVQQYTWTSYGLEGDPDGPHDRYFDAAQPVRQRAAGPGEGTCPGQDPQAIHRLLEP